MEHKKIRMIISGGGTGGHIFPAVSIAGKMMELNPENEILFVGAEGKMEMEKVPAAGFKIIGLPITGLQRQLTLKNILGDILTMIDSFLIFLPSPVVSFLNYLSASGHFTSISRGILDTRDLIYFVSLTALFFAGTVKLQQNQKN